MDFDWLQSRPKMRSADQVTARSQELSLEFNRDIYKITGIDPELTVRFLAACDGSVSLENIIASLGMSEAVGVSLADACQQASFLQVQLLPSHRGHPPGWVTAESFLKIVKQKYDIWNQEMFTQPLWLFLTTGKASTSLVDGWLLENYHFIRGAAARLAYATSLSNDDRITPSLLDHHLEEFDHYKLFEQSLDLRGIDYRQRLPLCSTEAVIHAARMAARRGPLHYTVCSGLLESSGSDTARALKLYDVIQSYYDLNETGFVEPLRKHSLIDQEYSHGSVCDHVLQNFCHIESTVANDIIDTARVFKDILTFWFNDIYRIYLDKSQWLLSSRNREYYKKSSGFS